MKLDSDSTTRTDDEVREKLKLYSFQLSQQADRMSEMRALISELEAHLSCRAQVIEEVRAQLSDVSIDQPTKTASASASAVADDTLSLAEAHSGERYGVAASATLISGAIIHPVVVATALGLAFSGHDVEPVAAVGAGLGNVLIAGAMAITLAALQRQHEARAIERYNHHALEIGRCVGAPGHTSHWPHE